MNNTYVMRMLTDYQRGRVDAYDALGRMFTENSDVQYSGSHLALIMRDMIELFTHKQNTKTKTLDRE